MSRIIKSVKTGHDQPVQTINNDELPGAKTVAKNSNDLSIEVLRTLIAIPSVTGSFEQNRQALGYIEQCLRNYGMRLKKFDWNGVESLVATTRRTKKPKVYLLGHVDVVPGSEDSFELTMDGERLYGRGVLDMKGAIAAFLAVVDHLHEKLDEYDFGIMIVTDEESGGNNGSAKLAEAGYIPKVIVSPDGGNAKWGIEKFAKGLWHFEVSTTGISAHGSRPWEGENAIDNLLALIYEMKALFVDQPEHGNTLNVGMINGGHAINQIPSKAGASIDMRFANRTDMARITLQVNNICERRGASLVTLASGEVMENDPADPFIAEYARITEKVIGRPIDWVESRAASDIRWFTPYGTRCIVAYPDGGGHHGAKEWITTDSLHQMVEIIIEYLELVAKRK